MKSFSDTSVVKSDLDAVDAKQTTQIKRLYALLGLSFALHALTFLTNLLR